MSKVDRGRGGLGLGLALVKGIVELHDGRVEAQSEGPGKGSCFTVELPVVLGTESEDHASPEARDLEGVRVLIVDDLVEIADALGHLLESHGATVCAAYTGHEAIERFRDCEPTHILLDIGLPDIDGYEVARRIRQHSGGRDIPIAALTGYGMADDIEEARNAGIDTHLTKPSSLDELIDFLVGTDAGVRA